jgi:hypothetical protein
MPQVLRRNLPPALYEHLLDRIQQRQITAEQLRKMLIWLDSRPEVPPGKWFKRFDGMTVCGDGALVKTFLGADQVPIGTEIF